MMCCEEYRGWKKGGWGIIGGAILLGVIVTSLFLILPSGIGKQHLNDNGCRQEDINQVVEGINHLSFSLYHQLNMREGGDKNLFFSPYSVESALLIAYEGARGNTREEMKEVLGVKEEEGVRKGFAYLYNLINSGEKEYELSTANALWIDKKYPVLESYKKLVNEYYGANIENVNICDDPEKARERINSWVEDETHSKIRDIIPQGVLNCNTPVVITNAIYFKGKWKYSFNKRRTFKGDFWVSPGKRVRVDMMRLNEEGEIKMRYGKNKDIEWIELPYKGGNISMVVLLPRENNISILDKYLDVYAFNILLRNMSLTPIYEVQMPKFKFETSYDLNKVLNNLGMKEAFTSSADFSGIDGTHYLYIAKVLHRAYIDVNEEGTEAAASTAVVIGIKALKPAGVRFIADHPFVFVIMDRRTDTILFMGRVVDPTNA